MGENTQITNKYLKATMHHISWMKKSANRKHCRFELTEFSTYRGESSKAQHNRGDSPFEIDGKF